MCEKFLNPFFLFFHGKQKRPSGRGGPGRGCGGSPATVPAPIDAPDKTWYIVEGGIKTDPTFTITIKTRYAIIVESRDIEVEIDCFGLGIKVGDTELIVDPRYNVAELRKGDRLVAISNKVRYRWVFGPEREKVYDAREFAELVKNAVKKLIEETINITAFS